MWLINESLGTPCSGISNTWMITRKKSNKAIKVFSAGFLFPGNTPVLDIWKAYQDLFLNVRSSYSFSLFSTAKGIMWKQPTCPLLFLYPTILFNAQSHLPSTGWFWAPQVVIFPGTKNRKANMVPVAQTCIAGTSLGRCSAGRDLPSSSPAWWALPPSLVPLLSIPCNSL